MREPVAITCAVHDTQQREVIEERQLAWDGPEGIVERVAVPARLTTGSPAALPALRLAPFGEPLLVTVEVSGPVEVSWLDGLDDGDGAILWPNADRATDWNASFVPDENAQSLPKEAEATFVLHRLRLKDSMRNLAAAISAGLALVGIVIAALSPSPVGLTFAAILLVAAAVAYPTLLQKLACRLRMCLPADHVRLGAVTLPPIRVEPRVERSGAAADPLIAAYCDEVIRSASVVSILGLSSPINLETGYVPAPLQVYRGAVPHTEIPDDSFSQIDNLLEADLRLKRMLGGEECAPEEAWRNHRHLVIIGQVGSGKTTILQRLSLLLAKGPTLWTTAVPVFLELHRLARRRDLSDAPLTVLKEAVVDHMTDVVLRAAAVEPEPGEAEGVESDAPPEQPAPAPRNRGEIRHEAERLVESLIQSGELTLFLDGLDEVSAPEGEEEDLVASVIRTVKEASTTWPDVRIVVTCRRASMDRYRRLPSSFVLAETVPFEQRGIEQFVRGYFSATPERASRLLDELGHSPRVRALASTPLLLALVTLIFEQRGSLPQRRTDIYRRCVALLLHEWDAARERDRHPRFRQEHKEDFLRKTAWLLHIRGSRYIEHKEIVEQLRSFLPSIGLPEDNAPELLKEITTHHGLVRTYDDDWYGFVHFALQEFFAAGCIGHWEPLTTAINQRHQAWWQEVLRLHAGSGDCTDLVGTLLNEDEDLFHTNLRLAGECIAEGTAVDPRLHRGVISTLHEKARETVIPRLDERLWQVLTSICDSENAGILWEAVADPSLSPGARTAVIRQMTGNPPPSYLDTAGRLLDDETVPPQVHSALVELIGYTDKPESTRALESIASDSTNDDSVRATAVRVLAQLSRHEAVPRLEELLTAQETPTAVRRTVARALRVLGYRGGTERILGILSDWHVETATRSSLASAVGELGEESALDLVVEALTNARLPSSVRTGLALSFKGFEGPTAATVLIGLLQMPDLDYGVRLAVADTLGHVARESHHTVLQSTYADVRLEAPIRTRLAVALGSLGDERVVGELVRLLGDRSARPYLRLEAARALAMCPADSIPGAMLNMIDSRTVDPLGQELAVLVIELRGEPEMAPAITERLADMKLSLPARMRMANTLAVLGNVEVIDYLISVLNDRAYTPELRARIAITLTELTDSRDGRAFERVLRMLPDAGGVPEIMTLLWHLSEQVGMAVLPDDMQQRPTVYDWALAWRKTGETG